MTAEAAPRTGLIVGSGAWHVLRRAGCFDLGDCGQIEPGDSLTLVGGTGTAWYTTDGSDPIVYNQDTGEWDTTPSAVQYTGGTITLTGNTHVKVRTQSGTTWSALAEASFVVPGSHDDLRITELMYNPGQPIHESGHTEDPYPYNESFEFIELTNTGAATVNLAGLRFTDGVQFTFPGVDLAPGEYVLIVGSEGAFEARYGTGYNVAGAYRHDTRLANGGETIALTNILGETIQEVDYKDGWFGLTDGDGFSLVPRDPAQDPALWSTADGWRTSWQVGGSPGAADTGPDPADIVVNEVLAHSNGPEGDWVELYNASDQAIDLNGWFLSDNDNDLAKYEITGYVGDTVLDPGEYLVLNEADHFGTSASDPGRHTGFAFSEFGEDVYLTAAVVEADLFLAGSPADWPADWTFGGYREDEHFGATPGDQSLGRFAKPSGGKDFVLTSAPTPGAANDGPFIPDVVINELMYHPSAEPLHEYVELYNRTDADVALWDHFEPGDGYDPMDVGWAFTDGVDFTFPAGSLDGAYVPAGGYALVVGIDPATFRTTYGIPDAVPIYGPFENDTRLSNGGERVALSRPGKPETKSPPPGETAPYVPYIEIEKITYDDDPPWPTEPDGLGPSLERIGPALYANDPAHWGASADDGTPGAANQATPPHLTGVVLNPDPARTLRTLGDIEPSGIGVRTVEIAFSEPVTFTADAVTVQAVHFDGADETVDRTFAAGEVTVDGSGTAVMTITIADSHENAVDTWVKVSLSDAAAALSDLQGHALDGEPRLDASGLGYLYDADADLPTGDGLAGGEAVCYVGSLRADMRGSTLFATAPDGVINSWDINGFLQKYGAGDLDADFRGNTIFAAAPDGVVDSWDINGFLQRYQGGASLAPLPTDGTLSAGDPAPLALTAGGTLEASTPADGSGGVGDDGLDEDESTASDGSTLTAAAAPAASDEDGGAGTEDASAGTLGLEPLPDTSEPDLYLPQDDSLAGATPSDPADPLAGPALDV
ncbi:MAG: lamin tail domain-containing protein, partial [Planctomycetota bacterium]